MIIRYSPFSAAEMAVFPKLFLDFCITGGMPEAVKAYIDGKSLERVRKIQNTILSCEHDKRRY